MTPYYVGELDSSCVPVKVGKEYYELAALVKTALRGSTGFAPKSYFAKVCNTVTTVIVCSTSKLQCSLLGSASM